MTITNVEKNEGYLVIYGGKTDKSWMDFASEMFWMLNRHPFTAILISATIYFLIKGLCGTAYKISNIVLERVRDWFAGQANPVMEAAAVEPAVYVPNSPTPREVSNETVESVKRVRNTQSSVCFKPLCRGLDAVKLHQVPGTGAKISSGMAGAVPNSMVSSGNKNVAEVLPGHLSLAGPSTHEETRVTVMRLIARDFFKRPKTRYELEIVLSLSGHEVLAEMLELVLLKLTAEGILLFDELGKTYHG